MQSRMLTVSSSASNLCPHISPGRIRSAASSHFSGRVGGFAARRSSWHCKARRHCERVLIQANELNVWCVYRAYRTLLPLSMTRTISFCSACLAIVQVHAPFRQRKVSKSNAFYGYSTRKLFQPIKLENTGLKEHNSDPYSMIAC